MHSARFLYLHGFASSPASHKAREFEKRLAAAGVHLVVPELDEGNFRELTLTRMLAVVDRALGPPAGPAIVIGSSMGGYLAALAAERRPDIAQLILMAPAFDFARRFAMRLGDEGLRRWRETGVLMVRHYGTGKDEPLGPAIIEDALQYPAFPDVRCPTTIFHGRRDTEVPPEVSEQFTNAHRNADLILLDDEHALTARFEVIWTRTQMVLAPYLSRRG